MIGKLSWIAKALLLSLLWALPLANTSAAQDFSRLQCPTLVEVRIGLLVEYGYCPVSQFYAKRYAQQSRSCDPSLSEDDVEQTILNDPTVNPNHKNAYEAIMQQIEAKRCEL